MTATHKGAPSGASSLLSVLCLLIGLTLLPARLASADAAVEQRIEALSQRITQTPTDQPLRLQLALAYAENDQYPLAVAEIEAAEAVGDPVEAAYTHGVLLYRAGDYTSARRYLDLYLQRYPRHPGSLNYRARLLRDSGEDRLALADYQALFTLSDSLDPGYYLATARLMASLPEHGNSKALALLDERMAQIGTINSLQRYAIELDKARGNFPAAIERMGAMDQKFKASPQWQVDMAALLIQAGHTTEAQAYLSVAQEQLQSGRNTVARNELLDTARRLQAQSQQGPVQPADKSAATKP